MIFLVGVLLISGIGIALYAIFYSTGEANTKKKSWRQSIDDLHRRNEVLKNELDSLREELTQCRSTIDNGRDKAQLLEKTAKSKLEDLERELNRRQEWVEHQNEMLKKFRNDNETLQGKFIEKDKALENEFAKNVKLAKEVRMITQQAMVFKEGNATYQEKISQLQGGIKDYSLKLQAAAKTADELKDKLSTSSWVTKDEYEALKEDYSILKRKADSMKKQLLAKDEQIGHLKTDLRTVSLKITRYKAQSDSQEVVADDNKVSQKESSEKKAVETSITNEISNKPLADVSETTIKEAKDKNDSSSVEKKEELSKEEPAVKRIIGDGESDNLLKKELPNEEGKSS